MRQLLQRCVPDTRQSTRSALMYHRRSITRARPTGEHLTVASCPHVCNTVEDDRAGRDCQSQWSPVRTSHAEAQ